MWFFLHRSVKVFSSTVKCVDQLIDLKYWWNNYFQCVICSFFVLFGLYILFCFNNLLICQILFLPFSNKRYNIALTGTMFKMNQSLFTLIHSLRFCVKIKSTKANYINYKLLLTINRCYILHQNKFASILAFIVLNKISIESHGERCCLRLIWILLSWVVEW